MSEWNQHIFEELVSNTQFMEWASGRDFSNAEYWNSWVGNNPAHFREFKEAVKIAKTLHFRGTSIEQSDIQYQWSRTSGKINPDKQGSALKVFLLRATKIAAILSIPILLVSVWLFNNQLSLKEKYADLLHNKNEKKITVIAPIGARITVDLPDGSKAWLNSGSEITYPVVFNSDERRVSIKGEAYFKIQKDVVPFYVSSLGPEIKVYGTEFNVNAYDDEDIETVALAEGKISLILNGKEEFIVPGQVSIFDKTKRSVTIENSDVNNYSSWREGKYILRDTPLSAILRILQRQHNVNIRLLDPELGNNRYNATINNESLEQILQLLTISAPIKYTYKHREPHADGTWEPDQVEIFADKTRIIKTKI